MGVLINLNTTAAPLAGGAASAAGTGEDWKLTIGGTWATGDKVTLTLTDAHSGLQTQVGAGNITGISPNFCLTFNGKLYMLAGSSVYFSEEEEPTLFNDPTGVGNSFITLSNFYATTEPLTGMAPYQGKLLFTSRRYTQIWQTDPDPANYQQTQVLANIGTFSGESLQPIGDLDVFMLADNGFRSVRVRDASDNAITEDVGAPIDLIVQPLLASLNDTQKAAACGVVDPTSNRYWCYIPQPDGSAGLIYVFSNFASSGIRAWSAYRPSYETVIAPNSGANGWSGLVANGIYVWTPGAHPATFSAGRLTTFAPGQGGTFVMDNSGSASVVPVNGGDPNDGTLTLVTTFVPALFRVYKGQVWVRDTNGNIYQYGGTNGNTYAACGMSAVTPFLSADSPSTRKHFGAIDAAFQGSFSISVGTDYKTGAYKLIYSNTESSFQRGSQLMNRLGTHYSFDFEEWGTGYALFSEAVMHYDTRDES